jgi:Cdc6-like AAA superfamily ATPase
MAAAHEPNYQLLSLDAGKVFTPTAPIDEQSLFAGRREQIHQVIDAVNQKGQHAIIFGERGVGKTSLSNVLSSFLSAPGVVLSPRVNCDTLDTFESVWRKVLEEVQMNESVRAAGLGDQTNERTYPAAELLPDGPIGPDTIRRLLTILSQNSVPILIVDEFDRLGQPAKRAFADTIKNLSDHSVPATVVLVGVADSVEQLIEEHRSVERALVQIRMPRMSTEEVKEIILTGLGRLKMEISMEALQRISILSQGLPHYAHLLGLHATRKALDKKSLDITIDSVDEAITKAIAGVNESIRTAYHHAVSSARKDNIFADVLLACALAETDELDYFAAQDVRETLRVITKKAYEIWSFAQHLNDFSDAKRSNVLQKSGTKRRFRYRFDNPLMQPFVIMQGLASGKIDSAILVRLKHG